MPSIAGVVVGRFPRGGDDQPSLVWAVVASLALQVGILTIPIMEPIFKVAPLPIEDWELMAVMALLPLAIVETVKWLRRR